MVWFYGILTITGYLMLNLVYKYILNIYDLQKHFIDNIFKRNWIKFLPKNHHHHHHHVVPLARISLTLSHHFSLSFISSGRTSGLHPVSSHSCCMYVRAGRPAFARPYVGVHRSTSLMSSSLLLQQCPAFLVRLTWIVIVMGSRWPYSWRLNSFRLCQVTRQKFRHRDIFALFQKLLS